MISVEKILEQVRIDTDDTRQRIYSDYQIIAAINKTLRLLSQQFAMSNTDFCERSIKYSARDVYDGVDLPNDFISLVEVIDDRGKRLVVSGSYDVGFNEYIITGQKIYAQKDVTMVYHAMLDEAEIGGYIDVPKPFFDIIVAVTTMILGNRKQEMIQQYIMDNARQMIPKRKYSNIRLKMPFRV